MRPIDADALEKEAAEWFQAIRNVEKINGHFNRLERMFLSVECAIMHAIRSLPTIDAVEVIRCGECEYQGGVMCPMEKDYLWSGTASNDFCSFGKRRSDDE